MDILATLPVLSGGGLPRGKGARAATLDNIDLLLALVQAYYGYDEIAFDAVAIRAAMAELLTQPALGGAWLIQSAGQTVGYFIMTFSFDLEFGGRQAFITDLYIAESHRRRGLGSAALSFAEDMLRQRGIAAYELQVERDNHEAVAFYERFGLQRHDRIPMSKRITA